MCTMFEVDEWLVSIRTGFYGSQLNKLNENKKARSSFERRASPKL
jgi:hypothetical protein